MTRRRCATPARRVAPGMGIDRAARITGLLGTRNPVVEIGGSPTPPTRPA